MIQRCLVLANVCLIVTMTSPRHHSTTAPAFGLFKRLSFRYFLCTIANHNTLFEKWAETNGSNGKELGSTKTKDAE